MPIFEGTNFPNPEEFAKDYVDRLRKIKPLDTLENNPIMGADPRGLPEMEDTLGKLKEAYDERGPKAQLDPDVSKLRETIDKAFLNRQNYLQELSGGAVKPFSQRLKEFGDKYGVDIKNLNVKNFGGLMHETLSHDLGYSMGFSPDYTRKFIRGYEIDKSPVSPINEAFAGDVDRFLNFGTKSDLRGALVGQETNLPRFYESQGEFAAGQKLFGRPLTGSELEQEDLFEQFKKFQDTSKASDPFFQMRQRLNTGDPTQGDARVLLDLKEADRILDAKFYKPLSKRFENLAKVQAPPPVSGDYLPGYGGSSLLHGGYLGKEGARLRGIDPRITGRNQLLNLGQNLEFYALDPRIKAYGGGNQQLFGLDPVGAPLQTAFRILRKNPTGAATGAALSATNPEVVKAVEKNDFGTAGTIVARDAMIGAGTDALLKQAALRVPAAATFLNNPLVRFAGPVGVGYSALSQGTKGSLTDILTKKAAENPVSYLPSVQPNPATDLGARASRAVRNEAEYFTGALKKGKVPYTNLRFNPTQFLKLFKQGMGRFF